MAFGKRALIEDADTIREFVAVSVLQGDKRNQEFIEATKLTLKTENGLKKFNSLVKGFGSLIKSDERVLSGVLESIYSITDRDRPPVARKLRAEGDAYTILKEKELPYDLQSKKWKIDELNETITHLKGQVLDRDKKIEILQGKLTQSSQQLNNLETNLKNNMNLTQEQINEMKMKIVPKEQSVSQGRSM